jgi:hypothetical protein
MRDKEFAVVRKHLDEAGYITAINRIMLKRKRVSCMERYVGDAIYHHRYDYRYRYEVIINGELVAARSTKIGAKKFIIKRYYTGK